MQHSPKRSRVTIADELMVALAALPGIHCERRADGTHLVTGNGRVDLASLTALPEGTEFRNGGSVYLLRLTALPEGTEFRNGGHVYLPSLTTEQQNYRGRVIRLRTIDGFTMLIASERRRGDYTISRARYFGGGEIDDLQLAFVAASGGFHAHGETVSQAIRDVRFKAAQADFDAADLIARVKAEGKIGFNEFRLLTGASQSGLEHGLETLGLARDTDSLPIGKAMELVRGQYGARQMFEYFGDLVEQAA